MITQIRDDFVIGSLSTAAHWRAATLPKWGGIALSLLLGSPFKVTYDGMPLTSILNAASELKAHEK